MHMGIDKCIRHGPQIIAANFIRKRRINTFFFLTNLCDYESFVKYNKIISIATWQYPHLEETMIMCNHNISKLRVRVG